MDARRDHEDGWAWAGSILLHLGIVSVAWIATLRCADYQAFLDRVGLGQYAALSCEPEVLDVAGPVIEATLVDFTAPPLPASTQPPKPKPKPPEPKPPQPEPQPEPPPPPEETATPPPAQDQIDQEKVRLAAEALEKAEREQEEKRKQEQIDLDRQEQLTQMERERQKQLEDIKRLREEAERKRKVEEQKLAQLQQQKDKAEADRRRAQDQQRMDQLAQQEAAQRAGNNGRDNSLLGQYKLAITNLVDRNWRRPDTLREGFTCNVVVTQIPGGDVIAVDTSGCYGDLNVIRSIEAAVQREPLPYRGFEPVFARKVTIPFCFPKEMCSQ